MSVAAHDAEHAQTRLIHVCLWDNLLQFHLRLHKGNGCSRKRQVRLYSVSRPDQEIHAELSLCSAFEICPSDAWYLACITDGADCR